MKTLFLVLAFIGLNSFSGLAQQVNHSTISTYSLNVSPATGTLIPSGAQTAIVAVYLVILKDSADVNKVYVKASSNQQTGGDLYTASYPLSPAQVIGANGLALFARHNNVLIVKAVISDPQPGINYEICTEDGSGHKSSYLSRIIN